MIYTSIKKVQAHSTTLFFLFRFHGRWSSFSVCNTTRAQWLKIIFIINECGKPLALYCYGYVALRGRTVGSGFCTPTPKFHIHTVLNILIVRRGLWAGGGYSLDRWVVYSYIRVCGDVEIDVMKHPPAADDPPCASSSSTSLSFVLF